MVEPGRRADNGEPVVAMDHGRVRGSLCFIAMADAGDCDARLEAAGNRVEAQSVHVRICDDERPAFERFGLSPVLCREVGSLPRRIDAEDLLEYQQRADDPDDGGGIGDGVVWVAAPNEGVLVEAPEKIPSTAAASKPASQPMSGVLTAPRITIAAASAFIFTPCWRSVAKKPGPSWRPIVKTNRINPNSFTKSSVW